MTKKNSIRGFLLKNCEFGSRSGTDFNRFYQNEWQVAVVQTKTALCKLSQKITGYGESNSQNLNLIYVKFNRNFSNVCIFIGLSMDLFYL